MLPCDLLILTSNYGCSVSIAGMNHLFLVRVNTLSVRVLTSHYGHAIASCLLFVGTFMPMNEVLVNLREQSVVYVRNCQGKHQISIKSY